MFSAADFTIRVNGATKLIDPSAWRRPRSLVCHQPPRNRSVVELGPMVVAVGDDRSSRHDLTGFAVGHLGALGIDDPHLGQRRWASAGSGRTDSQGVEGEHAGHLGLAVAGGVGTPRTVVDLHHGVPGRAATEGAESGEVVATLGVRLDMISSAVGPITKP